MTTGNSEDGGFLLESLPEHVVATMEVRDKFIGALGGSSSLGVEFLVEDVQKWKPGQTIKVAFLGGSDDLCNEIAEVTLEITKACNIKLDFGSAGKVRRWTEKDKAHVADIRVSFDKRGYFSLVGTDSINTTIGNAGERVGGRPYQCSLNLGGYAVSRPAAWKGTVLHEFLHALAFHHEHQNMEGECQQEFRWEDDSGYEPTTDANGSFVTDAAGKRPGIYTYLAGPPNSWSRAKVDHNLRPAPGKPMTASVFDRKSIMLYRFPSLFYKSSPSPCAPDGDPVSLSEGDRKGLRHLYPADGAAEAVAAHQLAILTAMAGHVGTDEGLEAPSGLDEGPVSGQYLRATAAVLARNRSA